MSTQLKQIKDIMSAQHAVHGMMADVFEELGGQVFLKEYAEENPRWFLTMFLKSTPNILPQAGIQGDVNITINENLIPTKLDSATLDEQGRVIDSVEPRVID